jgi:hypothetical protein
VSYLFLNGTVKPSYLITKRIKASLSFLKKLFLSKAERDYLTSNRQFDNDYSYTIKSRLAKKINQFTNQELPLLIENGYLTEFCKLIQWNLTENRKVSSALVAQLAEGSFVSYNEEQNNRENNENKSPRWDLNPRPKVSAPLPPLTDERGITKPSLCQLSY